MGASGIEHEANAAQGTAKPRPLGRIGGFLVRLGQWRRGERPLMRLTPIEARRLANFRANKRGLYSLYIFLALIVLTSFAELIANDKPILIWYKGEVLSPIFATYPETKFGGFLPTETRYDDEFIAEEIKGAGGFMLWPLIPYSYDTIIENKGVPAPAPPDGQNWLGTDDQQRDVLARVIYGFRMSVWFAVLLTFLACAIGVTAGAVQGYFGGLTDLFFQRIIEIWTSMPSLYIIIILSALLFPNFWLLLFFLALFAWAPLTGVVRAEFLRGRNFEYVKAAKALGVSDFAIIQRHVLPNAMVATLTMMPFIFTGAVTVLTSLDFLGFGLPPGSPSLGELVGQGKRNLHAPWLALTAFFVLAGMLSLVVFIGEAVRDAFDPRKTIDGSGRA